MLHLTSNNNVFLLFKYIIIIYKLYSYKKKNSSWKIHKFIFFKKDNS